MTEKSSSSDEAKALNLALGAKVKALRKDRNETQDWLATETGYSVATISLLERGLSFPSAEGFYQLSAAFGVEVMELFDFDLGDKRDKPTAFERKTRATVEKALSTLQASAKDQNGTIKLLQKLVEDTK